MAKMSSGKGGGDGQSILHTTEETGPDDPRFEIYDRWLRQEEEKTGASED